MEGFSQARLMRLFTSAPNAYWRHDVDTDLAAAVKMARFSQVAGVSGHYFLWPRSPFYNLFSVEGVDAVTAIIHAGHTVGLHCHYERGNVADVVKADLDLLDAGYPDVFGDALSFHMPPPSVLWVDFPEFDNAYASRWEGRYVSDSRGVFTAEQEARLVENGGEGMQANLHSEHWWGDRVVIGSPSRAIMDARRETEDDPFRFTYTATNSHAIPLEPIGGGMVPYS